MKIGIMGHIGVGKSSISKKISEELGYKLVEEPVVNNPFLELFYQDKESFALLSQNAFYSSLFLEYWKVREEENVVYDSTLLSNLTFTELMRLEGIMNAHEVALTYSIADAHLKLLGHPDLYVVFHRPKEQMFGNIKKRGRTMELAPDLEEYLNFHHDNYIDTVKRLIKAYKIPQEKVLFLELDGDYLDEKEKLNNLISAIQSGVEIKR